MNFPLSSQPATAWLITNNSYEALPPNFSLGANMVAGAFAGIAVCSPHQARRVSQYDADMDLGAFRHVSY